MPNIPRKYKKASYIPFHVKYARYHNWPRMPPMGQSDYSDLKLIVQHHGTTRCPCGMCFYFPREKYNMKKMAQKRFQIERHLKEHLRQGYLVWVIPGNANRVNEELVYLQSQYPGAEISAFQDWAPKPDYAGSINVAAMQRDFDNSTATRRLCTARKTMGPYRNRQSLAPHKRSRLSTTRRPTASAHKLRTAIRPKSRWTAYTGHADESADEDELQFLGFVPGHQTVYGSPGGPQSEPPIKEETPSDDEDMLESALVRSNLRSRRRKASSTSSIGTTSLSPQSSPLRRKRGSQVNHIINHTQHVDREGPTHTTGSGPVLSNRAFARGVTLSEIKGRSETTSPPPDPMVVPLEYSSESSDDDDDNGEGNGEEKEWDSDSGYGQYRPSPEI